MVSAQIIPPNEPFIGEGQPTIPTYLTMDRETVEELLEKGKEMEQKLDEALRGEGTRTSDIQVVWRDFKTKILKIARAQAKKKALKTN
jgi:hypothetical protein